MYNLSKQYINMYFYLRSIVFDGANRNNVEGDVK